MKYLERHEIVGSRIYGVFETPGETVSYEGGDPYEVCSVYVQLESGTLFSLSEHDWRDNRGELPIPTSQRDIKELVRAKGLDCYCSGRRIREVVISTLFPFFVIGLLLEDDLVLYWDSFSPWRSAGILNDRTYFEDDLLTYWGHHTLKQT